MNNVAVIKTPSSDSSVQVLAYLPKENYMYVMYLFMSHLYR